MTILVNIVIIKIDEEYYILTSPGCSRFLCVSISYVGCVNNHRHIRSFIQRFLLSKTFCKDFVLYCRLCLVLGS